MNEHTQAAVFVGLGRYLTQAPKQCQMPKDMAKALDMARR